MKIRERLERLFGGQHVDPGVEDFDGHEFVNKLKAVFGAEIDAKDDAQRKERHAAAVSALGTLRDEERQAMPRLMKALDDARRKRDELAQKLHLANLAYLQAEAQQTNASCGFQSRAGRLQKELRSTASPLLAGAIQWFRDESYRTLSLARLQVDFNDPGAVSWPERLMVKRVQPRTTLETCALRHCECLASIEALEALQVSVEGTEEDLEQFITQLRDGLTPVVAHPINATNERDAVSGKL